MTAGASNYPAGDAATAARHPAPQHRRNFRSIVACELFWNFGLPFSSASTVLPLVVLALGGRGPHVGALAAINEIFVAGSVLAPWLFNHAPRLRNRVIVTYVAGCGGYLLMALGVFGVLTGHLPAAIALPALLLICLATRVTCSAADIGYRALIAQNLESGSQLTGYGKIFCLAYVAAMPGGALASWFHRAAAIPPLARYALSLLATFILVQAGNLALLPLHNLRPRPPDALQPRRADWRQVLSHSVFRRYILARIFFGGRLILTSFLAVYAARELGLGTATIVSFVVWQALGGALGMYCFGHLAQRYGAVHSILYGAVGALAGIVLAVLWRCPFALGLAMFLDGAATASQAVTDYGLPLEIVGEHEAIPFYAAAAAIPAIPLFLYSFWVGDAVFTHGYVPLAVLSAVAVAASVLLFGTIAGMVPGQRTARERAGAQAEGA
jgi:hypothetical protein